MIFTGWSTHIAGRTAGVRVSRRQLSQLDTGYVSTRQEYARLCNNLHNKTLSYIEKLRLIMTLLRRLIMKIHCHNPM